MLEEMSSVGPKLAEKDVVQFEKDLRCPLPASYKEFLLKFNGGRPTPHHYLVPGWHYQHSLVNDFYGIVPGQYNDLEENIELLEDRLPKGFIPIADDPGGNCILISLDGETRGRVYFWDHENEPEDATDDLIAYSNIYLLANDFDQFLNNLRGEDEFGTSDTSNSKR